MRPALLLGGLTVALCVAVVVAAGAGAYALTPAEVLGSVAHRAGLAIGPVPADMGDQVLWEIRFPRIALALIVGGSLGVAGAVMQGAFANPLAEPGVIGVSSGAVVGAVAHIVLGLGSGGTWSITGAAFLGGLVTVFGVYTSARADGRTEVVTLVLTGIAVNAMTGAIIGLLMFFAQDGELRSITFWTLGSVGGATWARVAVVFPVGVVATVLAFTQARQLDLLALGERPAAHLGVDVERLRITCLTVVALLTAAAVAVSGIVMFVGLVTPHLVRMVAGPRHTLLLPASALGGSLILVSADLVARVAAAPAELPLGVLTSLLGSPLFFWLLRRTRSRQGGWA
ncbi:MAG: iron ABC transporter permease [Dehalococcoidia bacterium]|nr:iron ABC transporter permease [Dehalococcoidia bacterium]